MSRTSRLSENSIFQLLWLNSHFKVKKEQKSINNKVKACCDTHFHINIYLDAFSDSCTT